MAGNPEQPDTTRPEPTDNHEEPAGGVETPAGIGGEGAAGTDVLPKTDAENSVRYAVAQLQRALQLVEPGFRRQQLKKLDVSLERDKAQLEHEGQESVAAVQLEIAKLEYEAARSRTEAEQRLTDRVYRTRSRVTWIEAWLRALLAGALVAGTIAIVVVGILKDTDPQELSQYLAPMTGLTGLAVGYVFGVQGATDRGGSPSSEPAFTVTPDEKIQRTP